MNFKINVVNSKTDTLKFIKCQWNFYKKDKNFVPPIIADRKKLLDTNKNPFFKHSEIQLFIAEKNGDIIGRIAAIINDNHNITHNDNTGFFGFFECINEQQVANALFDAAQNWLAKRGMNKIRGPENPSQNDEVGLLVEGFGSPPVFLMTYNPRYYIGLIEGAGFIKAKDLFAYLLQKDKWETPKLNRMQDIIRRRYNVQIRNVNFKNKSQFQKDIATIKDIYNQAWELNWGFVKMTNDEFDFLANDLKMIADPDLAFFAESNGEAAGFAIALPDINQCLIHNKNGSLTGALYHLFTKKKKIDMMRILVLGVIPKFRNNGIDAVMYWELGNRGIRKGIYKAEASWVLEDNVMMNRGLTVTMNADIYKIYRIYEKDI